MGTTVSASFINKAPSQSRLIVGNLFLIVVNWKNAMGPSRLSTPTISPTTHWALVCCWTPASGTIQDEMEENIDLEPQLHAMMCPDMAARSSANSQMLLGSGPGADDAFAVFTWKRCKQINKEEQRETNSVYHPLPGPSSSSAAHSCLECRGIGETSGLLACNSILQHIRAGTFSSPDQNLHSSPTAGDSEIE